MRCCVVAAAPDHAACCCAGDQGDPVEPASPAKKRRKMKQAVLSGEEHQPSPACGLLLPPPLCTVALSTSMLSTRSLLSG